MTMRTACLVLMLLSTHGASPAGAASAAEAERLRLLPYPKEIEIASGKLQLGPARYVAERAPSETERVARESLDRYLPREAAAVPVRLGSVEEGYPAGWLPARDREFLANPKTSPEASVLTVSAGGVTVVGKGKWGMLYGVQTLSQLARGTETSQGVWKMNASLPCLTIRDWPDMAWRCLSPQMTWYSGYNRLEGYDNGNWTLDEWKWLVDWSLLHKCNGWALCMYGNWPFTLPGYEETTLDVDSFFYDPRTGRKQARRFTHGNIRKEFLPELIRYANRRGVKIYAYVGKNTFNGTYGVKHPDANAGGAAELIPFHPGVHEYWDAFLRRIVELGFNGFVFEDPEALHVPNQNARCYQTFWEPWAKTYGFKSVAETDQNNPPLGVHVEYYSWLFRVFDEMIQRHAAALGRPQEIYLISHVLLSRMVSESKTREERDTWFALIDKKQGRKVPFIILEADEPKYVSFLGRDRVASLGGRGGSCTNAMRRIASINNNWSFGPMGGDLAYERQCQKHLFEAGGFGAMGYVFEWTSTEVFGYLASQYLWRNAGVPGIDNESQTGFLDYSYRFHYGDGVGALVARIMDESSCVNDAMMLEGVYGSQYPSTGAPLDRDYQYLAVQADRAVELAKKAFLLYTGGEPDLYRPVYRPEDFRFNGFDQQANRAFNAERLRLLWVSTRRSQKMCESVLAHRLAQRLTAEGAPAGSVLKQLDRAIDAAKANQLIYQLNYDDDYDWTDGLCARVTEALQSQRDQLMASVSAGTKPLRAWTFDRPVPDSVRRSVLKPLFLPWEKQSDVVPEARAAAKPGLYLSTDVGCDAKPDFYRLGVVFTVEAQGPDGTWRILLRTDVARRTFGWEHWDVPLAGIAPDSGRMRLRFMTDSYSRAQDRSAPSWKWALWGEPQVVEVGADGSRRVRYDFLKNIGLARAFVRLDGSARERPFDRPGADSTGATFKPADPGVLYRLRSGEGRPWQWVEGFAAWVKQPPQRSSYRCYLGSVESGWVYAHQNGELSWLTAPVAERRPTAVAFIGSTGYGPGKAELWCDGRRLLAFETAKPQDCRWEAGGIELRYLHGGDTRSATIPFGISGVYLLRLPASHVAPGRPLNLVVRVPAAGGGDWFMVHEYRDAAEAAAGASIPVPRKPAITAFTPHLDGKFGVTVAEYSVELTK